MRLAALPMPLIDYVLLHELLHTRIKRHGPEFWQAFERLMPDARKRHRELSRISLGEIVI